MRRPASLGIGMRARVHFLLLCGVFFFLGGGEGVTCLPISIHMWRRYAHHLPSILSARARFDENHTTHTHTQMSSESSASASAVLHISVKRYLRPHVYDTQTHIRSVQNTVRHHNTTMRKSNVVSRRARSGVGGGFRKTHTTQSVRTLCALRVDNTFAYLPERKFIKRMCRGCRER